MDYLNLRCEHIVRSSSISVMKGVDSQIVLDRMVSTKLSNLDNMGTQIALFCDANGRVEDIARLMKIDEQILIISSPEYSSKIRGMIVSGAGWDEDCSLLNGDDAIAHITLVCKDEIDPLSHFGLVNFDLLPDKVVENEDVLFSKEKIGGANVFEILLPIVKIDKIMSKLNSMESEKIGEERWEFLRIGLGQSDIQDARGNLPNESGLGELVSLDKGCYPGQEIHARVDSRGRLTKQIVRIVSNSPIELGAHYVEDVGKINLTSSQYDGSVNLSLGISPIFESSKIHSKLSNGAPIKIEKINDS